MVGSIVIGGIYGAHSGCYREGKEEAPTDSWGGRASIRLSDFCQATVRCGNGQA